MKTPRRFAAVLAMTLAGGAAAPLHAAGVPDFWVYFGTYTGEGSDGIYVARMDAYGNLSQAELAAKTTNPAFLAVDPRHRFLYSANEVDEFRGEKAGMVSAYAINAQTGALTPLNQVSTVTPGPCFVSVDATGKVVLAANYGGGSVESFPVQADGSLGEAASCIRQTGSSVNPQRQGGPHAHMIAADPANRFALLCDLGLDQVLVFKLDPATATLTPNDPPFAAVAPGAGPRHFAFRPDGRFVYVIDELDCTMTVFAYDAGHGTLTRIQTVSTLPPGVTMQPGFSGAEVIMHPSGRFLYGSNRGHDSLVVFAIDRTSGGLRPLEHVPSGGHTPRSFNIDPTGHYLVVANQESNSVLVLEISQGSGRLIPAGTKIEVGHPVSVVFVPAR